jgi:hypothetical protein
MAVQVSRMRQRRVKNEGMTSKRSQLSIQKWFGNEEFARISQFAAR